MKQITHSLIQGSREWHEFRAKHFGASELSAAAGASNYTTRNDLLKEKATGISKEVSDFTQSLFNKGHESESGARPVAERVIGDDLFPSVMSLEVDGIPLSASLDGINFDGNIIFEHKLISEKLIAQIESGNLDEHYKMQMDQQLLVSGAEKCLFMTSDGTENNFRYCWYETTSDRKQAVVSIWKQFAIDVANYKHVEAAPEVIAAPVQDLPALSIQVNGSISLISNLQKFGARLNEFVSAINKEPSDDQGFADAEAAIKTLQNAQDALEAAEANALAQTSDIDDMRKTVKLYADTARTTRLMLEKMVKARKESIRIEIVQESKTAFGEHIKTLESEIKPIILDKCYMPDFAAAIKGKKTITSLREAAGTALRNGKMEADALAADIRAKLVWCKESSAGYDFLFSDLQTVITSNGMEAFQAIVQRRIDDHKAEEAAKLEAQRIAIQAAADAKAKAEADAVLAKERAEMEAKVRAEELAKAEERAALSRKMQDEEAQREAVAQAERQRVAAENKAQMEAQLRAQAPAKAGRDAEAARIEEIRKQEQIKDSAQSKGNATVKMVSIPKSEYEQLLRDYEWLACLTDAGVDKWEGFNAAREIFLGRVA